VKIFLLSVFILILAISLAVYGFKYWQVASKQQGEPPVIIQNTLIGVLRPIPSTGEYSDIIVTDDKTIGITSSITNLKPYENRKVKVVGEYSGNTMYIDSITIVP
jgi:hypothetical protein